MKLTLLSLCVAFLALSTARASMDKESCRNTNWKSLGNTHGREGRTVDGYKDIEQNCIKKGVPVDQDAYIDGYSRGIAAYCTRANGKYVGSLGEAYRKQCPARLEEQFLTGYVEGKREYDRKSLEQDKIELLAKSVDVQKDSKRHCDFDSDCELQRSCSFSKCSGSKTPCTFDSDCTLKPSCQFGSCEF